MLDNRQALPIGTLIKGKDAEYIVKDILGMGSFGITYLVVGKISVGNLKFDVPFAIKEHFMASCLRDSNGTRVLCTPSSKNEVELSRSDFYKEAKRMQQLCTLSKNIVNVNEVFEANGTAYYVMEFLNGGAIKPVDYKKTAVSLILQVCDGVAILHANRLLHLDIKPANIIYKHNDETGEHYPVLIDFGISKHFDANGSPTTRSTAKGASPGYAPIEQYDEIDTFQPTVDIYALGATLYYLLTGKNPPASTKLCYDIAPLRKELESSGSGEFADFICKAMTPNATVRHQSIDEFASALRAIVIVNDSDRRNQTRSRNEEPVITGPLQRSPHAIYPSTLPTKWESVCREMPELKHLKNTPVEALLKDLQIVCNRETGYYGIIKSAGEPVSKIVFDEIGDFVEKPNFYAGLFKTPPFTEWCVVAPFTKKISGGPEIVVKKGWIMLLPNGKFALSFPTYADREYVKNMNVEGFGEMEDTVLPLHGQSLELPNGKKLDVTVAQIPGGKLGILSGTRVLAPFTYDEISPITSDCTFPMGGPGYRFIGARYKAKDKIGCLRVLDDGTFIDFVRCTKEEYDDRCTWT